MSRKPSNFVSHAGLHLLPRRALCTSIADNRYPGEAVEESNPSTPSIQSSVLEFLERRPRLRIRRLEDRLFPSSVFASSLSRATRRRPFQGLSSNFQAAVSMAFRRLFSDESPALIATSRHSSKWSSLTAITRPPPTARLQRTSDDYERIAEE